ncbi:probable general transcription factor IIH subunit 5 [Coccomyxa sp. Obi]|nr:probable general transcription factor IIH subunit 5 [Coccomyxa sp. Obi]
MVSAIRGVLLQCDVPAKEFILSLNDSKPTNERFVILDLDDTHLFVQPTVVEWLEKRLKEFNEENTYQPPRREDVR